METGLALGLSVLLGISTGCTNTIDNALKVAVDEMVEDGFVEIVDKATVSHFAKMPDGSVVGLKLTKKGMEVIEKLERAMDALKLEEMILGPFADEEAH